MLKILVTYYVLDHADEKETVVNNLAEYLGKKYEDLRVRVAPLLHCGSLFSHVTQDEYVIFVSLDSPAKAPDICLLNEEYNRLNLDGRIRHVKFDKPSEESYTKDDINAISSLISAIRSRYAYNRVYRVQKKLLVDIGSHERLASYDTSVKLRTCGTIGNDISDDLEFTITNNSHVSGDAIYIDILYIHDFISGNKATFKSNVFKKAILMPNESFNFSLLRLENIEWFFGVQDSYNLVIHFMINDKEYTKEISI